MTSIRLKKSALLLCLPALLVACSSKEMLVNRHITVDFFAKVEKVVFLNTEVETLTGAFTGAIEGAEGVHDRRHEEAKRKGSANVDRDGRESANLAAFFGAVVGGINGLSKDLDKTYSKYQFELRDVDSNEVTFFYSDTLLSRGDCVYVDVGKVKNQNQVKIKRVKKTICESNRL